MGVGNRLDCAWDDVQGNHHHGARGWREKGLLCVVLAGHPVCRRVPPWATCVCALLMRAGRLCVRSFPNVYGIDMPTKEELVAHDRTEAQVAAEIGADAVVYLVRDQESRGVRRRSCSRAAEGGEIEQDLDALKQSVARFNPALRDFESSVFDGRYVTGAYHLKWLGPVSPILPPPDGCARSPHRRCDDGLPEHVAAAPQRREQGACAECWQGHPPGWAAQWAAKRLDAKRAHHGLLRDGARFGPFFFLCDAREGCTTHPARPSGCCTRDALRVTPHASGPPSASRAQYAARPCASSRSRAGPSVLAARA
jgi:hypothetical protein